MTNSKASMLLILSANMRRNSIKGRVNNCKRIAGAMRRYILEPDFYQSEDRMDVDSLHISVFTCGIL